MFSPQVPRVTDLKVRVPSLAGWCPVPENALSSCQMEPLQSVPLALPLFRLPRYTGVICVTYSCLYACHWRLDSILVTPLILPSSQVRIFPCLPRRQITSLLLSKRQRQRHAAGVPQQAALWSLFGSCFSSSPPVPISQEASLLHCGFQC